MGLGFLIHALTTLRSPFLHALNKLSNFILRSSSCCISSFDTVSPNFFKRLIDVGSAKPNPFCFLCDGDAGTDE